MTQVVKETIYTKDFQRVLEQTQDTALKKLRREAFDYFAEHGFPTVKDEEWKYTNVASMAGKDWNIFASRVPSIYKIGFLERFDFKRNGFTALNLALGNFYYSEIPKNKSTDEPIVFEFGDGDQLANMPHIVIYAGEGSEATIIESYIDNGGAGFVNSAIQIFVGDNAKITHYRVQKNSSEKLHVGTTEVTLGRGSHYNTTNINLGAKLSRHDVHVKFTAEGAEAFVDGLYMLGGEQHSDTHSTIDHAVPNCISHQTYKGILGDRSRGVFNGKVFVRENAHGTDAQQSNKNLLLSNDARVDTKPQLEIFNDDVKCAHGATVGQLDDEEVFYLLSRGIHPGLAQNLLTYGFAEEIINKIGIEQIKRDLDEAVLNRLNVELEA